MLVVLLPAARAAAQPASGEIAGGYSFQHLDGLGMPEGWFVSGAVDLTPALSVVGEVFSNGKTLSPAQLREDGVSDATPDDLAFERFLESGNIDVSVTIRSAAGGIRYGGSRGRTGWFVQSVAGPAWIDTRLALFDLNISLSPSTWIWQTGGGVDVSVSRRLALRLRGDYRRMGGFEFGERLAAWAGEPASTDFTAPGSNGFVLSTGLVLRIGALRQP